jgi:hypothetical protein
MEEKGKTRNQVNRPASREAEQVLREAAIVARWAKKPFYIA